MEANYEYRFDKNGVPIAVTTAFGKRLSKELPLEKMVAINEKVSDAAATFVKERNAARKTLHDKKKCKMNKMLVRNFSVTPS